MKPAMIGGLAVGQTTTVEKQAVDGGDGFVVARRWRWSQELAGNGDEFRVSSKPKSKKNCLVDFVLNSKLKVKLSLIRCLRVEIDIFVINFGFGSGQDGGDGLQYCLEVDDDTYKFICIGTSNKAHCTSLFNAVMKKMTIHLLLPSSLP